MAADGVFRDSNELKGLTAYDAGGEKIGHVQEVYFDDRTGRPDWVTVKTGMFGTKESFVPLAGARSDGDALHVAHDKATVKDAPRLDAGQHLDVTQEQELFAHYGLSDRNGVSGAPGVGGNRPSAPLSDRDMDASMVRSEEQPHVETEEHEVGRARLRKVVVTENVTTTVPVSHEEVRVVHEPIDANDRAASGGRVAEGETEVTLHAEQPVARKETVGVERVRMETEKVTEQQEVRADVRKEEIKSDNDDQGKPGRHR
ncbi:PRC and DUF2382 domain-containing protein [Streptomyces sp. SPB162]|uniref:PRC and DUF2382 domain-containing protein n=1 Tax=Streptomyces sp. SPB162 TaxID=2940560 RepID=UPI0024072D1E|nr:PRC and DUF2382 domain-containing protein [Streptomyces sp. SPB162]MDF9810837.1 uncharacterized protein (TIGR02271 family) [Streptomyces sp. SPB162]